MTKMLIHFLIAVLVIMAALAIHGQFIAAPLRSVGVPMNP